MTLLEAIVLVIVVYIIKGVLVKAIKEKRA
jgi:hypothetical protein